MSINSVVLTGRICNDIALRYTPAGVAVSSFTIASDTGYGEKKQTSFVPVVCWRQLAELTANHLSKGSRIGLEGKLSTRSYENKEGKKVFVMEVVADSIEFLDSKKQDKPSDPFASESKTVDINDDDLPF